MAEKHGLQIYSTIREALTLRGSDLAVDAVCFVGEHGEYPRNDRGQRSDPFIAPPGRRRDPQNC